MGKVLKDMSDKANAVAELFHTPFLTIVWRMAIVAFLGIALYAFNAYKHEAITGDSTVVQILTDAAATRALLTSHEVFIQEQAKSNVKLDNYFKEAREDRDKLNVGLTKLETHLTDQDSRLDRIERKQDSAAR